MIIDRKQFSNNTILDRSRNGNLRIFIPRKQRPLTHTFLSIVLALICQKCSSTSLKNCDKHIRNMTCIYPMDICITMTTSYTIRKQNGVRETISEVTKGCALSKYGCENMCNVQPGHNCQVRPRLYSHLIAYLVVLSVILTRSVYFSRFTYVNQLK